MQPLTSPNLRNISSSKLRKDDLIARYIKGQKGYVSGYARDSRNMLGNISEEPPNGEKQVLASGFATPVLKPRVPPTGTKNVVKTATTSNSPLKSTSHAKRSRSTDKRPPKSGASKNEAENVDPRKHSVGKPIRKRPMTPDPDEERGASEPLFPSSLLSP
ncbi:hypothetical protein OE88DRAFT_659138 [Heliocybe sulcata]|uniref:Uncharacterized protein n=1 Tax=Heliocybe sulcata TaxID=5364 RepID=A0A5C3NI65_9AGAM|nr:hypothetical protein OE88DRAFT_659138 [Heliocybe sulcata]